jgi:hypothetical protein
VANAVRWPTRRLRRPSPRCWRLAEEVRSTTL